MENAIVYHRGQPIEDLDLSYRTMTALKRVGIATVEELRALDDDALYRVRNLGAKGMREIKEALHRCQT